MSRCPGRLVVLVLILVGALVPAIPPAAAHPDHLQVANESVAPPADPVDVTTWVAQSFVPTADFFVARVSLLVADTGASDTLYVSVRSDDGTGNAPVASNLTEGSAVGTATASWTDFDMAAFPQLTMGTTYWIVLRSLGTLGNGYSYSGSLDNSAYPPGTGDGSLDGLSWVTRLRDYTFRVYGFMQPTWSFSASQSTSSPAAGDSVIYRANFSNGGSGDAAVLWVNFTLPAELAYVGDDAGLIGGVRTGTSFAFTAITPGVYSFALTASVVGGLADGMTSSTTITFTGTDHNGIAMAPIPRTFAFTVRAPRLSLSLTATASLMDPGDDIALNATVTNVGSSPAFSVRLEGTVDRNATFNYTISGFASYNPATRTVGGVIANVGPFAIASLVWNVTVSPGTPDLAAVRSNATVTYHDATGSPLSMETTFTIGQVQAPVFAPAFVVDRAFAERGDVVAATLYFNNTGSGVALRAVMDWDMNGNYALVDLVPVTPATPTPAGFDVPLTNLGSGPHQLLARLRVVRGMSDGLAMPIQVRWSATDGGGTPLPPATLSGSVTLRAPAPSIALAPATVRVESGSTFIASLTLRNAGGAAAWGWCNLTLPSGFAYVDDNVSFAVNTTGNRVSWFVPVLGPGSVVVVGVRLRSVGPAATATLRFTFNYTDGRGSPAASIVSNSASIETLPAPVSVPVIAGVGIGLAAGVAGAIVFILIRRRRGQGGPLIIDDAFVVNDGGVLLAHRSSSLIQYQDEDILIGMFKAVQDFVKDSFSKGIDEDMKGLEFGDRKILIEKGPHHFIAVVHRGTESRALRERMKKVSEEIEGKFGATLAHWGGLMDQVRGIADLLPQVWGRAP